MKRDFGYFCRVAKIIALGISLIIISVTCSQNHTDHFQGYDLVLSTPQTTCSVGDTIVLNFEIRSTGVANIRLCNDRTKSLIITCRSAIGNDPEMSDNDFSGPFELLAENEKIDTVTITPKKPHLTVVKGVINLVEGHLVLDFGTFGRFEKRRTNRILISGWWCPINPHALDSMEDYTNTVYIDIKYPN